MKVLLIQIRQNNKVKEEEFLSFLQYSGLDKEELVTFDAFEENFKLLDIYKYDGVFIGGSSAANVLEPDRYPFVIDMIECIKNLIEKNIPTLASCFGFQVAALALQSQVIDDRENFEMGTIPINKSQEATKDILLCDTPENFMAVSVHQQKVLELPENCIKLAYTQACLHSFKVVNKDFWAFQFHPEVDRETLVARLRIYQDKYTSGLNDYQRVIDHAVETHESNRIIRKFVERVLRR